MEHDNYRYDDPEQEAIGRDDMLDATTRGSEMLEGGAPELPWVFYDLTDGTIQTSRGEFRVVDWESVERVVKNVLHS